MSNLNDYPITQMITNLNKQLATMQQVLNDKIQELEKLSNTTEKVLIRLEDEKADLKVQVHELKAMVDSLTNENNALKHHTDCLRKQQGRDKLSAFAPLTLPSSS